MEGALDWFRSGGNEVDDPSGIFSKIDKMLPAVPAGQSEVDRAKDMEIALDWLTHHGVDVLGDPYLSMRLDQYRFPDYREVEKCLRTSMLHWIFSAIRTI
jgi:hypothetical protein